MNKLKRILVVDDDPLIRLSLTKELENKGYRVITAISGENSIEITGRDKNIDLILMDLDLGSGIDGPLAAKKILSRHKIPLIFLAGPDDADLIKKIDKIASYGIIEKSGIENIVYNAVKNAFKLYKVNEVIKKRSQSLVDSEIRYRRLFEAARDGILILDSDTGAIIDVNPYLMELTGYTYTELIGKYLWEISPFKDIAENKAKFEELKKHAYVHYENLPLMNKNGDVLQVEFVSNTYQENYKKVIQCNIRDISRRKMLESFILAELKKKDLLQALRHHTAMFRLKEKADTDPLTQLYNRRGLFKLIKKHYKFAYRHGLDSFLIYIDINNFKEFNDKFGHAEGDKILVGIADLLKRELREWDVIARMGGDEFVLMVLSGGLNEINSTVIPRINEAVSRYSFNKYTDFSLSFGVSRLSNYGSENIKKTLDEADKNMYKNKKSKNHAA